jgi:hypothetical protein
MNTFFKIKFLAYHDEEYLQFIVTIEIWNKSKVGFCCSSIIHKLSKNVLWSVLYMMDSCLGEFINLFGVADPDFWEAGSGKWKAGILESEGHFGALELGGYKSGKK